MGKSTKGMSLSVPPEMIDALDEAAANRGHGVRSKLACELFEDFMRLNVETHTCLKQAALQRNVPVSELVEFLVDRFPIGDESVKPVVLRIPVAVMQDRDKLKSWLLQKVSALVNHLHPEEISV